MKLKTAAGNSDGSLLSEDEYASQRLELLKEKSELERFITDGGQAGGESLNLSAKTFEFGSRARAVFAQGDSKTKKMVLSTIGSNLTLTDKKLNIEARLPFFLLESCNLRQTNGNEAIEPKNSYVLQGRNEHFAASRSGLGA